MNRLYNFLNNRSICLPNHYDLVLHYYFKGKMVVVVACHSSKSWLSAILACWMIWHLHNETLTDDNVLIYQGITVQNNHM